MLLEPTLQTAKRVCESLAVPTASGLGIRWYRGHYRLELVIQKIQIL